MDILTKISGECVCGNCSHLLNSTNASRNRKSCTLCDPPLSRSKSYTRKRKKEPFRTSIDFDSTKASQLVVKNFGPLGKT